MKPHRDLAWSDDLHPELGILVATMQDSTREYRSYLESPSLEAIVWSPYPGGPSIGGVLLHIASSEMYWLQMVAAGETLSEDDPAWAYDIKMDQYEPNWPVPPAEPIEWYYGVLDGTRTRMIEYIRRHNQPDSTFTGTRSTFTYRWILAHLAEHDAYHGGQAVLLHEMYKKIGGP